MYIGWNRNPQAREYEYLPILKKKILSIHSDLSTHAWYLFPPLTAIQCCMIVGSLVISVLIFWIVILSHSSCKTLFISLIVVILSEPLHFSILFFIKVQICSIGLKSGEFGGQSIFLTLSLRRSCIVYPELWDAVPYSIRIKFRFSAVNHLHSGQRIGLHTCWIYHQESISCPSPHLIFITLCFFPCHNWVVFEGFSSRALAAAQILYACWCSCSFNSLHSWESFHSLLRPSSSSSYWVFNFEISITAVFLSSSVSESHTWNGTL